VAGKILFATPFGLWYNTVLLAGEVPWQWMIPASWVAFGLAALARASYPFALIPAVAFLWMALHRRQVRATNELLTSPFRIISTG
jgi:4-amino-4-deoxy-L-arabinose transferase-like glycosyltransferase